MVPGEVGLVTLSDWDEVIKNDMELKRNKKKVKKKKWPFKEDLGFYLCNRWNKSDHSLDESEFSFKVKAKKAKKLATKGRAVWRRKELKAANALYLELQKNPIFVKAPSIFFVDTPASSTSIEDVCKMNS